MGHHQSADTGVGLHGTTLRQTDTDLFHVNQFVDHEIQACIRQRGITHSRTDTLEFLNEHFRNRQMLILGIAPDILPHLLMHPFRSSLSQTVSQ